MDGILSDLGFAIFPKDNYLFREFSHSNHVESMFFAFSNWHSFTLDRKVESFKQKWKTNRDLKLLLLLELKEENHYFSRVSYISNINEAFRRLNPEIDISNFNDLTIKQYRQKDLRPLFSKQLVELGYDGWITTIEGNYPMELYLCCKDIKEAVSFDSRFKPNSDYSSMHNLKLYPNESLKNQLNNIIHKYKRSDLFESADFSGRLLKENSHSKYLKIEDVWMFST